MVSPSTAALPNTSSSSCLLSIFLPTSSSLTAQYLILSKQHKVYKIHNLTDEEATLLEPAACALHGLDKLSPPVGVEVLVLGAGPTGLILAQLLKLNGAAHVTIAANAGPKMNLAKDLECGDKYVELARGDEKAQAVQWADLRKANPYGFDIVVEATGCGAPRTRELELGEEGRDTHDIWRVLGRGEGQLAAFENIR